MLSDAELAAANENFQALSKAIDDFNTRHDLPDTNPMKNFFARYDKLGNTTKSIMLSQSPEIMESVTDATKVISGVNLSYCRSGEATDKGAAEAIIILLTLIAGALGIVKELLPLTIGGQAEGGVSAVAEAEAGVTVDLFTPTALFLIPKLGIEIIIKAIELDR